MLKCAIKTSWDFVSNNKSIYRFGTGGGGRPRGAGRLGGGPGGGPMGGGAPPPGGLVGTGGGSLVGLVGVEAWLLRFCNPPSSLINK